MADSIILKNVIIVIHVKYMYLISKRIINL